MTRVKMKGMLTNFNLAAEKYRGSTHWHTTAYDVTVGQTLGNLDTRSQINLAFSTFSHI